MKKYGIIIEKAKDGGFGAYAPDLPGCVGMGETRAEAIENIAEAIVFHLEGMAEEGLELPEPTSEAENLVITV